MSCHGNFEISKYRESVENDGITNNHLFITCCIHGIQGAVLNGMSFWFLRSRALIIEIWDVRGADCETIVPFKLNVLETVS